MGHVFHDPRSFPGHSMNYDSDNGNGFDHGYGLPNGDGRGCRPADYFEMGKWPNAGIDHNGYGDGGGFGFGNGDGVGQ